MSTDWNATFPNGWARPEKWDWRAESFSIQTCPLSNIQHLRFQKELVSNKSAKTEVNNVTVDGPVVVNRCIREYDPRWRVSGSRR
jgi:hypothetical protein